ncbi:MAG: hypothetical protein AAGA54_07015 [Myxococcota bacterium]
MRRVRGSTQRLAERLRRVEVDVTRETPREGGRYICRVRGLLGRGGEILVKRDERDPKVAIAAAVERFRRSLTRQLERAERRAAA